MFEAELDALENNNLLRRPLTVHSGCGPSILVNNRKLIHLCSNDYLGLADHPLLREAARLALKQFGCGTGASRLVSGTHELHRELEAGLAKFKNTDAALLFNSGYAANTGIIPVLAEEDDTILSDSLNHASIIDGCRLSRAETRVYPHRDVNALENLLKQSSLSRRRLIVTDSVFSMDGDVAPLPDIVELGERYDAIVMVDDAHATGVLGAHGRGSAEHFGLQGRIQVQMGTLGKALGSYGAYVAGDRGLIDFLANQARSYMFSTSLPPSVCAASIAALTVVDREPERRAKLWANRERLIAGMMSLNITLGPTESPIIPLMVNNVGQALAIQAKLLERGVLATAIRFPTVAPGAERIRMTVMATHTSKDIDEALAALEYCVKEDVLS